MDLGAKQRKGGYSLPLQKQKKEKGIVFSFVPGWPRWEGIVLVTTGI